MSRPGGDSSEWDGSVGREMAAYTGGDGGSLTAGYAECDTNPCIRQEAGKMIGELQNWLTLIATVSGIYIAFNGLWSWKREHTGKRDIELCQEVIEMFYEAEHRISGLRSPILYSGEGSDRPVMMTKPRRYESEGTGCLCRWPGSTSSGTSGSSSPLISSG